MSCKIFNENKATKWKRISTEHSRCEFIENDDPIFLKVRQSWGSGQRGTKGTILHRLKGLNLRLNVRVHFSLILFL